MAKKNNKDSESNLLEWNRIFKEMNIQKRKQIKEFNQKLRKPDAVLTINDCEYGYWKINKNESSYQTGVLRIRKNKYGYDMHSMNIITCDEIITILKVWNMD